MQFGVESLRTVRPSVANEAALGSWDLCVKVLDWILVSLAFNGCSPNTPGYHNGSPYEEAMWPGEAGNALGPSELSCMYEHLAMCSSVWRCCGLQIVHSCL